MNKFKYFKNVAENAEFIDENCDICNSKENCLEGVYFSGDIDYNSVCLKCLLEGKVKNTIPSYVIKNLEISMKKESTYSINSMKEKIKELEKTPPIPWIQYNNWPSCCGDFACYIGEWEQEDFINYLNNKENSIVFLNKSLDESTKNKVDDINVLWEDIGYNTAAFVFQCLHCGKFIITCQSY